MADKTFITSFPGFDVLKDWVDAARRGAAGCAGVERIANEEGAIAGPVSATEASVATTRRISVWPASTPISIL